MWWPPKIGTKLYRREFGSGKLRPKLVTVVAIFRHDGEEMATIAEWRAGEKKRWTYTTIKAWLVGYSGEYWPANTKTKTDL